jgi:GT2 family glycosyltransferase
VQIDVIMLAFTKDEEARLMTQRAIDSLHASSSKVKFNIHLLESYTGIFKDVPYSGANIHFPEIPFHYNKYINYGLNKCLSEYILIANTDLEFHPGWIDEMLRYEWDSASPISPGWPVQSPFMGKCVYGYGTSYEVSGWCILTKRSTIDAIGGRLDEQFDFYAQDTDYACCLREKGLKHAIIGTARVSHKMNGSTDPSIINSRLADARPKIDAKWLNKFPNIHKQWLEINLNNVCPLRREEMTLVDCVMLANTKNQVTRKMTQEAIWSLHRSSSQYKFNVFVVETEHSSVHYDGATVIQPRKKFNYNQFLNIGFEKCKSDYIIISNNDVLYHPGWFEEIVKANCDSATPLNPIWNPHRNYTDKIVEGYRTGLEIGGWCIIMKKSTLDKIGKFDEQFDLYYQDDDYGMQLKKHNLVHKLVGTSRVTHFVGKTSGQYNEPRVQAKLCEAKVIFDKKYRTSLCLTMIVRDESKIILEALNSIYKFIDYWVIVDTGSTDNTKEIITNFFKEKNIPGELYERPWVNFAHNRTEAFDLADGKADYMMVMDADDLMTGEPELHNLRADFYNLIHGETFKYHRAQIFKSGLKWKYIGVLHEAPASSLASTRGTIVGNYRYISRTQGFRSKDPNKYANDAKTLEAELLKEPNNTRYWFYLGQSYFDSGNFVESKRAYARRVELGGWLEEVFYAQYRVALCCMKLDEPLEKIIFESIKAFQIKPDRIESLVTLCTYLRAKQQFRMCYPFALSAAQVPYPVNDVLFVHADMYEFRALEELAIALHYVDRIQDSCSLYKEIVKKQIPEADRTRMLANIKAQEEGLQRQKMS